MNRIVITGRITKDLELKKTPSGKSVCSFTLAVKRGFDRKETDFINCVVWNAQAESLVKYQRKGSQLAVDGTLQIDKYQDKDGNNRQRVYVQTNNIEFLDSKKETAEKGNNDFADLSDDDLPF